MQEAVLGEEFLYMQLTPTAVNLVGPNAVLCIAKLAACHYPTSNDEQQTQQRQKVEAHKQPPSSKWGWSTTIKASKLWLCNNSGSAADATQTVSHASAVEGESAKLQPTVELAELRPKLLCFWKEEMEEWGSR